MKQSVLLATVLFGSTVTSPVMAQQSLDEQKNQIDKEKALVEAQTALITAKTAHTKAKFGFDDLPSFENKTELGTNGGEIESALLISTAVEEAAKSIEKKISKEFNENKVVEKTDNKRTVGTKTPVDDSSKPKSPKFLIIAGANELNFNLPIVLQAELESLESRFKSIPGVRVPMVPRDGGEVQGAGLAAVLPFVTALSGLLGTETSVTGVDVGVDDKQIAVALAGRLSGSGKTVRLYHHDPGRLSLADLKDSVTGKQIAVLKQLRDSAMSTRKSISPKRNQTASQKTIVAKIDSIVADFDSLYGQITKRGDDGYSTYIKAVLLGSYNTKGTKIVRVKANKSGGSLIHSKNIWTTFGVDPLKASGGLIVSYSMVNTNGDIEFAGQLACRTSLASLRKIQSGKWKNTLDSSKMRADCR